MTEKKEAVFSGILKILVMAMVFCVALLAANKEPKESASEKVAKKENWPVVVLDAGHGGNDPGKVGINGALEKDVNLQIASILQKFLEANDIQVVMTRTEDAGLYDEDASNKKVQDMKRRIALIEEANPLLVVSIHQNSYQEEYAKGAQVFYYTGSTEGQALADKIQTRLIQDVDPQNNRQIKANDSYYLLKKTGKPIVIVECGFLSNNEEAKKLVTPLYQEKMAWAIHLGIIQYINETEKE